MNKRTMTPTEDRQEQENETNEILLAEDMRRYYPEVIVDKAGITMWDLIVKKGMPPTRMVRYCCDVFKEGGGKGRIVVTGVRWARVSAEKTIAEC